MAIAEYEDMALRYAGSLPDGTDVEYTPRPERILSAADQQYATRAEVAALAARFAHVERLLHRAINAGCVDDYGEEVVSVSGTGMGIYATRRATPPLAAAERTELEALRAFKASVPYEAIRAAHYELVRYQAELDAVATYPHEYEHAHSYDGSIAALEHFLRESGQLERAA